MYVSICNEYNCVYLVDGVTGNSHYRSDGSTSKLFHLILKQNVVHNVMDTVQWRQGMEKQCCGQCIVSENMNTQTHQQHLFFSFGEEPYLFAVK